LIKNHKKSDKAISIHITMLRRVISLFRSLQLYPTWHMYPVNPSPFYPPIVTTLRDGFGDSDRMERFKRFDPYGTFGKSRQPIKVDDHIINLQETRYIYVPTPMHDYGVELGQGCDACKHNKHYRHYKGGMYTVIGEGIHTETEEALVFYRADADSKLYARPRDMFYGELEYDGKVVKRFRDVD